MQKQDFFSKQQNRGTFSWGTIRQQPKQESWWHTTLWVVIILLIILWIGAYFYKDKILTQEFIEPEIENPYEIWKEIQEEGILSADGDLLNYTHSLATASWDIFLLKSKTISLNNITNLSWTYIVEWTIESIYSGYPLVEVKRIQSNFTDENQENIILSDEWTPRIFVENAMLWFPIDFNDNYTFVGEAWENNSISIKNFENEKITKIDFFNCSDSWDTNCKQLTKTFDANATKKITTLNGDIYYKLPDVKSWYFQNWNWRGYFINDADDEEVEKLTDYIIIPNTEIIKDIVTRYGVRVCLWSDDGLNMITSHSVSKTANGLLITMKGEGDKYFTCEAYLDLSENNQLKLHDLKIEEKKEETEVKEEQKPEEEQAKEEKKEEKEENKDVATTSNLPVTPSVKQFPINLEKTMTYNSSRGGYSMIFPSSNISYTSDAVNEDFNQVWVRCGYTVKAIQYKYKEDLQTNPSIIVYECSFKNGFELPWENFFLKELNDKKFVIEVREPSWFDFAKNIQITWL